MNPDEEFKYIVHDIVGPFKLVLCNANEGREYQSVFKDVRVYFADTPFVDLPVADFTNPVPAPDPASAFQREFEEVNKVEDDIANAADEQNDETSTTEQEEATS